MFAKGCKIPSVRLAFNCDSVSREIPPLTAMRRAGSQPTSPSCRSCCGSQPGRKGAPAGFLRAVERGALNGLATRNGRRSKKAGEILRLMHSAGRKGCAGAGMQLELLYRRVLWQYPPSGRRTARNPQRARVDDGLDYMLKDDGGGVPVRAREWICHQLVECAGVPVVEHRPILTATGRVLFGSRVVLSGGPAGAGHNLLAGTLPIVEARSVLSSIYAVDLFLGNGDRHSDNFIIEPDGASPRIRVIDFSEAEAFIGPASRTTLPHPNSSTVTVGRTLRGIYGFSTIAAELALDRLDAVTPHRLKDILDGMPDDWLLQALRDDLAAWWASSARANRITIVRTGLFNGTLL